MLTKLLNYKLSTVSSQTWILWLLIRSTFLLYWGNLMEYSQDIVMEKFTLVLLNPDIPCLWKQCRSRSVGFFRSQLIWICSVCHSACDFISVVWIKKSDWLTGRNGRGSLIDSAWQGLININVYHDNSIFCMWTAGSKKKRKKIYQWFCCFFLLPGFLLNLLYV